MIVRREPHVPFIAQIAPGGTRVRTRPVEACHNARVTIVVSVGADGRPTGVRVERSRQRLRPFGAQLRDGRALQRRP